MSAPPAPEPNKRRLPMVPSSEIPPEDEERPPWHWSAVATVGAFVFWIPLIFLVNAVTHEAGPAWGVLNGGAFAVANLGAGAIVGRFGGKAGKREAMVGGAAAGALAWLAAFTQTVHAGLVPWIAVLAAIAGLGAAAARAGAALGLRRRLAKR